MGGGRFLHEKAVSGWILDSGTQNAAYREGFPESLKRYMRNHEYERIGNSALPREFAYAFIAPVEVPKLLAR